MEDVSIMYASCHTYKSLWLPFLKLKDKYIGKDIVTYFCTDKLNDVLIQGENLHVLEFGQPSCFTRNGNYFDRHLYYLQKIETNYILYFYDDMFPLNYVNMDKLRTLLLIMKEQQEHSGSTA